MFAVALVAGRRTGRQRPAVIVRAGFGLLLLGMVILLPLVPRVDSGWWLVVPLAIAGSGLGLLVSQLNNFTLAPISEEGISEAAGVNSAAGSFGLSFGLAMAGGLMLAVLAFSFTNLSEQSTVLTTAEQQTVAAALEEDAQVMTTTALDQMLADEPQATADEIIRINDEARTVSLQVALLVPTLAALLGLLNSMRMMGLPDIKPSAELEGLIGG